MVNCVSPQQKKSAEYKAAMERFNIPSSVLEILLHEYQNLPENAEKFQEGKLSFPPDSWIQEHLYAPAPIVTTQKQIDIYDKYFAKPIVVATQEAANNVVNEAAKYFSKNSIKIVETADGKYQIIINKPAMKDDSSSHTRNELLAILHNIIETTVDNRVTDFEIKLSRSKDQKGYNHFYIFVPLNYAKTDAEFIEEAKNYLSQILPSSININDFKVGTEAKALINGRYGITVTPANYKLPKIKQSAKTSKSPVGLYNTTERRYIESLLNNFPGLKEAYRKGELDLSNIDFTDPNWETNLVNYYNEQYNRNTVTNTRQEQDALSEINDNSLKSKANQIFPDSSKFVEFIQKLESDNEYISQFLNHIIDGYKKAGIEIKINYDDSLATIANASIRNKVATININRAKYLASMLMEIGAANKAQRILLHELIHPLTADAAQAHPSILKLFGAREEDLRFNKEINELYEIALNEVRGDWYGLTNVQEFVSELMTNQEFQAELAKIPYKNNASLFNKFVQLLKDLLNKLGFDISNTLLEKSLQVTHNYVQFTINNGEFALLNSSTNSFNEKNTNQQFFEDQTQLANQLDAVYGIESELSAVEFEQISRDIVYAISDIITEIQNNPESAQKYNKSVSTDDLRNASRADILAKVGVQSIIDFIKDNYFGIGNTNLESFEDLETANVVAENMDAFIKKGASMLMQLEGFSITNNGTIDTNIDTNVEELDPNNTTDEDIIQEVEGSLQEHWQTESRTENAFDKASALVRQALTQCYQLDAEGNPVVDKWGIRQRMDGRAALQSIIKWTQGALSLSSMITKLEAQVNKNKWVQPILDRLKDTSGKESSFQSQFFGVTSKYFQLYSVGKKQGKTYTIFEVNTHPALTDAKRSVTGQFNAGVHPLFDSNGRVNKTGLEQLKSLWESLKGKRYTEETTSELTETLSNVSKLLGYPIAEDALAEVLNPTTFARMTTNSLQYIIKDLEKNVDNATWQPFSGKKSDNGIINNIGKFIEPITERLEDVTNTSFYDSGNMYQSYVTPSYVTKLIQKFNNSTKEDFAAFIEEEYGKYRQFKAADGTWKNSWLELIATQEGARQVMTHKVQLNFDGNKYMVNRGGSRSMSDVELTLSLLAEYFKENGHNTRSELATSWFRVPLMSNKPSSEFIKFYSYRGDNYKNRVLNGCMKLFAQELDRIQTVKERAKVFGKDAPELIKNFDDKRGLKFCFFDFLNNTSAEFDNLVKKVTENNATEEERAELSRLARDLIRSNLESKFAAQLETWKRTGVVEAAKKIQGIDENFVESDLENFFWNDFLAANNILNLTITDLAYYKNTEDVQKRLAQLHAPGIRANIEARDFNGNRVADSKTRTIYLKDVEIDGKKLKSNIIENVRIVFDKKLKELEGTPQYNAAKATYDNIIESFRKGINVADAQGYASPTSYRKKALLFGKWDTHAEEIYQKLMKGNYTYTNLKTAFQPLKPFVYTQIEKDSGVDNASLPTLKMGVQNKNSEYLLMLANAITQNEDTGLPNYLRAIYEIMEESHKGTTDKNGNHIPRIDGIDTVQFESTVKTGLTGRIDITEAKSTEDAKRLLEDLIYSDKENHIYDKTFVQELNLEDYAIQQEVPEHFRDHEQQQGSQIRMITISDLNPNVEYSVEGKKVKANEFRREYEETVAANIQESIDELRTEFGLNPETSKRDRNIALAKVLQREILSSPRYGLDLLMSCMLDENGDFKLPLGDPIQSKRIEQLVNSIIKNRINKQKIAGGPIVQVSNFGTSRQLSIRFKGKDSATLETLNDYLAKGKTEEEWKDYVKENQAGIAYYEAFVPAYMQGIFENFMDENGNIDIESIEATNPDLLKLIGYRIPSEDKYSMAPIKIVGFMPKEAGDGIMLPYEITLITGSDFDVDKFYVMRKDIPIRTKSRKEIVSKLKDKFGKEKLDDINIFLDQLSNSQQREAAKSNYSELWKEYVKIAYKSTPYTEGRKYRNNKIVDMTWEVLTHEDSADKVLNPGGFEEQKYEGYLVQAARITGKPIAVLEAEVMQQTKKSPTDYLKDICSTDENLAFIGTHIQFYKQNAAASSILSIFAVAKVAHACLESNGFQVDVNQVCEIDSPVSIMGLTLFDKVELDPQKDILGNFIGKTLGSLVASAADAVKDPVLNLMNINSDTVNILNTLVRMGLPFNRAARLLSTQVVTDLLTRYNTEKLSQSTSFNRVLGDMIAEISDANNKLTDSKLTLQDLTEEEVDAAILKRDGRSDYKILLALQRINQINSAMRSLNFATRFNSISSAVGPLIIDNLKIENNLNNFAVGIYKDGVEVGFDEVFSLHPILAKFADSVDVAMELFGNNMPANSTQFRNIIASINHTTLGNLFYRDRKAFSKFNDFYQSYLLIANDVIPSSKEYVEHYLKEFPTEFAKKNYKEKFAGNPLIEAIRFDSDSESGNATLRMNITGLDVETKSKLTSGWLDLYKIGGEGKRLASDLFYYNFYKGGIGFNPQTFMSLLPVQLKMRLKGYKETFAKLPEIDGDNVINQFIRNNWNDDSIVPYRKFKTPLSIHNDGIVDFYGEEAERIKNTLAFKTMVGRETLMFIREAYDPETGSVYYRQVTPLGNNGEFMEISSVVKQNSVFAKPDNPVKVTRLRERAEDITDVEIIEETVETPTTETKARSLALTYYPS